MSQCCRWNDTAYNDTASYDEDDGGILFSREFAIVKIAPGKIASGSRAVFLVGFMGAGKTSVGRLLGKKLGWRFEDLDLLVERRERRSVEAIFRESGELAFRRAEHEALGELLADVVSGPMVVALGGGAFVQRENAALLEEAEFRSVFLDAHPEELFRRCQAQQIDRPLRVDQEQFRKLYESRRDAYSRASLRIDTSGKDLESIAIEIANTLGLAILPE